MQSRYYDPVTCKFINADEPSIIATNPYNIMSVLAFDYCNFNPVMYVDKVGYQYDVNAALKYDKKWWNGKHSSYYNYGNAKGNTFSIYRSNY